MLHEVTFSVPKGRTVAVVGESGSGKSTLVRLLLRFYSPDSGAILLDGVDIATMSLQDLRRDVAIVPQDTLLFNETIEFNIAVGNPTATRVQVAHAMSIAGLEPLIRSLPLGGETVVGERGLKLSGRRKATNRHCTRGAASASRGADGAGTGNRENLQIATTATSSMRRQHKVAPDQASARKVCTWPLAVTACKVTVRVTPERDLPAPARLEIAN